MWVGEDEDNPMTKTPPKSGIHSACGQGVEQRGGIEVDLFCNTRAVSKVCCSLDFSLQSHLARISILLAGLSAALPDRADVGQYLEALQPTDQGGRFAVTRQNAQEFPRENHRHARTHPDDPWETRQSILKMRIISTVQASLSGVTLNRPLLLILLWVC